MADMPPLVLIEINTDDGLSQPVVTKEDAITMVTIDWHNTPDDVRDEAIRVLSEYEGEHSRIDLVLERLRTLKVEEQS